MLYYNDAYHVLDAWHSLIPLPTFSLYENHLLVIFTRLVFAVCKTHAPSLTLCASKYVLE